MRDWGIATNDYWYTASVFLEDKPWYLFALERTVMFVCDRLRVLDFIKLGKDWSISSLFHVHVCMNVTNFVWERTNSKYIELPYFFLKERFPECFDEEMWGDEDDEDRKNNEKTTRTLDKRFRDAYITTVEDWLKRSRSKIN